MSGITGIFRRDGQDVDPADIKKMNDKIAHRGPDGSRVWCEGPVAFGHQMLHTTQESLHEILPFGDKESGLVITADARIDNRKDLAPLLGIEDNEYVSDSYFILKAYEKWGERCPEELLGDFAFAIWDGTQEKLFCARDHMGIKPFYYYLNEELFVFSTEIKAIFELEYIPQKLNKLKFAFYFLKLMEDKKYTFYDEINRFPSSNTLTLDSDKTKSNQYWVLDRGSSILMDSEQDYFEEFKRIFSQAVQCRLRSVHNVGFELSGGLDSSSIVCMSQKLFQELDNNKIFTFSHIFPKTPKSDESYYIQKIVDLKGIEPHYIASDRINPLENIEEILYFKDQPFNSPHTAMFWILYKQMQKNKIRIMLSGEGGDDVISHGKYFYRELFLNFDWLKLLQNIIESSKHRRVGQIEVLKNNLLSEILPEKFINIYRYFKGIKKYPDFSLFDEKLLSQYPIEELYLKTHENILNAKTPRKYHYYSLNNISHQTIFESIDHSISSFGIEPRFPYLDKRLVEYCYAVPTEIKYNNGWSRYLLRKSMEDILPKEVAWRPQKGRLGSVFRNNFYKTEHILKQILKGENKVITNYLNLNSYRRISEKYPKKISNANYLDLWLLLCFYLWIKKKKID